MSKQNIEESVESRVCFEELEDWVREKIQRLGSRAAGGGSHGVIRAGVRVSGEGPWTLRRAIAMDMGSRGI